jgi:hypothetical protein
MTRNTYAFVAAALAIGLVASACHGSPNSATTTTSQATATQLQSLIPTPANTQRTDGPTSIPDNGIHMHSWSTDRGPTFWTRTRPRSKVRAGR